MAWRKSIESGLVSAFSATFAAMSPLILDGKISQAEWLMLIVMFGSIFFAYLKTHDPNEGKN